MYVIYFAFNLKVFVMRYHTLEHIHWFGIYGFTKMGHQFCYCEALMKYCYNNN